MLKRYSHRGNLPKNLLACLVVGMLVLLAVTIRQHARPGENGSAQQARPALPPDVDSVMRDFSYQDKMPRATVDINGREAVLRGRKVMAFRTNLAKTTFLKTLTGSIASDKHTISFTADAGEWDATKNSPFVFEGNIRLKVDGKTVPDVKSFRIYFDRRVLEAEGDGRSVYDF